MSSQAKGQAAGAERAAGVENAETGDNEDMQRGREAAEEEAMRGVAAPIRHAEEELQGLVEVVAMREEAMRGAGRRASERHRASLAAAREGARERAEHGPAFTPWLGSEWSVREAKPRHDAFEAQLARHLRRHLQERGPKPEPRPRPISL